MKKQVLLIIGIMLAIAIPVGFYFWKKKQDEAAAGEAEATGTGTKAVPAKKAVGNDKFPLKKGSAGVRVKRLQEMLNKHAGKGLTTDGKFGAKTEAAVFEWFGTFEVSESQYSQLNAKELYSFENKATGTSGAVPGATFPYFNIPESINIIKLPFL